MTTTIGGGDRVGLGAATLFSVGITLVFGSNLARGGPPPPPPPGGGGGPPPPPPPHRGGGRRTFAAVLAAMGQESVREL